MPVLIGAVGMGYLESLKPLSAWHRLFEVIGGTTMIFVGLYLLNEYFFIF